MPQLIYNQTVSQKIHMVLTYGGNDSAMSILKEKGISNPVIIDRETRMNAIVTTGIFNTENRMPVQLEFVKTEDKDGNPIIRAGTKMIGTAAKDKLPVFDSIVSDNMDKEVKEDFLKSFQNMLSQFSLPDKKMAVGNTFSQVTPINLPIGPIACKMILTTTYKLISLNDSLANFNMNIKYSMDMNSDELAATGGGTGSGIMIFDRINEYPLKYGSDFTMDLVSNKNSLSMHAVLNSSSLNECTISKK